MCNSESVIKFNNNNNTTTILTKRANHAEVSTSIIAPRLRISMCRRLTHVQFAAMSAPAGVFFMSHHLRYEIKVVLLLDQYHVWYGASRGTVSDVCHVDVFGPNARVLSVLGEAMYQRAAYVNTRPLFRSREGGTWRL